MLTSVKMRSSTILLFAVFALSIYQINSAPTKAFTTETPKHIKEINDVHTTLSHTDLSKHSVLTKSNTHKLEDGGFHARLVIGNSRSKGSLMFGLSQDEAEHTCSVMAEKQRNDVPSDVQEKSSSLNDLFRILRRQLLNRFTPAYKSGSLFAVHNMVQYNLLNNILSHFISDGTYWTGGKLIKEDGHFVLKWLDKKSSTHPNAEELLGLDQNQIDKINANGEKEMCLSIKKIDPEHRYHLIALRKRLDKIFGINTKSTTTVAPTTTESVKDEIKTRTVNGIQWVIEKCTRKLPYICLLQHKHISETTAKSASNTPSNESKSTDASFKTTTHPLKDTLISNNVEHSTTKTTDKITEEKNSDVKKVIAPISDVHKSTDNLRSGEGFVTSKMTTVASTTKN